MRCMIGADNQDVVFLTDCSDLVKMVSSPSEWPAFATYLEDIQEDKEEITSFSLIFIPRSQNGKADNLARRVRSEAHLITYVNDVPSHWLKANLGFAICRVREFVERDLRLRKELKIDKMQRSISSTAKRYVRRNHQQGKGNLCWGRRDFAGGSGDYRDKLRNDRLSDLKLDDVVGLFGDMVKSRPRPSTIDFNKFLTAIAKMKKFDLVISFGEQMQKLGISHSLYTYNIFINCFCRSSQLPLALAIIGKMMKLVYEPNVVTLSSLVNGFCRSKRISDVVAFVDQMVAMGYQPNTVTFNTLIHGLFLHNRASEDVALVDRMVAKGC
ncbi:PREDICTED: pentatricopeptide repeat-containing protein At1g63400-like [Camelina sativa]|uniref:Pentatricopeptide repeat-containing protein At1g63400-like n=1 Tax=Camelina sativa TaxID=90675 RepID=A0ABM1RBH7_CAMSA|nr:PREDICTED: pentatricopeptide repeat-containing protein At1g63400-like [Camelina sativa]